jgi:hypothetical protein
VQTSYFLIPVMIVSLVLTKTNQYYASPVISLINRWLRWVIMAGGLAEISRYFGWLGRPYEVLFVVYFIAWFWFDGIYRWLAIQAVSFSPLPLFPRFAINQVGDEWPVQRRFLTLRDTLRSAGFNYVQSVRAEVATSFFLRLSIYQDKRGLTRAQVAFLPQPTGCLSVCFQFSTQFADGTRVVTDNHYLPFAGFYPETWQLERKPNTRDFYKLLKRHGLRVEQSGQTPVVWSTEPVDDLNAQQSELERLNVDMGFLLPRVEHDEHGRISHEGRFRVWKEMLSLSYLGRPAQYD